MRLFLSLPFLLIFFSLKSQTIVTLPLSDSEFCQGAGLRVPFAISGPFSTDNVYTAQISDSNGDFSEPTGIGFVYGFHPDTIDAAIPETMATGIGYRIRVVSSAPNVEGIDNGIDLSIIEKPVVTLQTIDSLCLGDFPFDLAGGFPVGGFYSGPGVDAGAFNPTTAGLGFHQITYSYTAPNGCVGTGVDTVFVADCTLIIKKEEMASRIKISPNPAKDQIQVENGGLEIKAIAILTINGQVLSKKAVSGKNSVHTVSMKNLQPGMYLIVIEIGDERLVEKIVVK
jgi:hypothetical protein